MTQNGSNTDENDRLAIGGNKPPGDLELLRERLAEDHADLKKRKEEIEAQIKKLPTEIQDEETAGKIGDIVRAIQAFMRDADQRKGAEKRPLQDQEGVIENFFRMFQDPIAKAKRDVEWNLSEYQRRKRAYIAELARQQAAAAAAEKAKEAAKAAKAEAKVAKKMAAARKAQTPARREALLDEAESAFHDAGAARRAVASASVKEERAVAIIESKPSELTRTRGAMGSVQSLTQRYEVKVVNEDQVPLRFKIVDLVALRQFVNRTKGKEEIPGVEIVDTQKVTVR